MSLFVQEEIAEISKKSMKELWEMFNRLEGEYEGYYLDYKLIRYGEKVKFRIFDLWEGNEVIIKVGKEVEIDGTTYEDDEYEIEKDLRRKRLVKVILENVNDDNVIKPRT